MTLAAPHTCRRTRQIQSSAVPPTCRRTRQIQPLFGFSTPRTAAGVETYIIFACYRGSSIPSSTQADPNGRDFLGEKKWTAS